MRSVGRVLRLLFALAASVAVLIVLPALWFGALGDWRPSALALAYLAFFFFGTFQRSMQHGELAARKDDRQVKSRAGRWSFAVQLLGLGAAHWLALYDFAGRFTGLTADGAYGNSVWTAVAGGLIVTAFAVNLVAVKELGRFFDRLVIKDNHTLVTTGIYGVVRHPIYTSYILLFTGYAVMLESLVGLGLLAVVAAVWFGTRIRIEEEMLVGKFGGEYKSYQKRTKKIVPFIY